MHADNELQVTLARLKGTVQRASSGSSGCDSCEVRFTPDGSDKLVAVKTVIDGPGFTAAREALLAQVRPLQNVMCRRGVTSRAPPRQTAQRARVRPTARELQALLEEAAARLFQLNPPTVPAATVRAARRVRTAGGWGVGVG